MSTLWDPAVTATKIDTAMRQTEVSRFATAHRHHGVEPICRVLSTEEHSIVPSSVRSALARPTCARRLAAQQDYEPCARHGLTSHHRVHHSTSETPNARSRWFGTKRGAMTGRSG